MQKRPYWEENDFEVLVNTKNYVEMFDLAHTILKRIPVPAAQVCGPITTGAKRTIAENLENFKKAIDLLTKKGHTIFDQTPFEEPIVRLKMVPVGDTYPHSLLEEFYLPIFKTGKINKLFFLPGWEHSTGAKWEHDQGKSLNMEIVYLPEDWETAL